MIKKLFICMLFLAMSLTAGMSAEERYNNIEDGNNFVRNIRKEVFIDYSKNITAKFVVDLNQEYNDIIVPLISDVSSDISKNYENEIEVFENSFSCYLKDQEAAFAFPKVLYENGLISMLVKKELNKDIENTYDQYRRKSKEKSSGKSSEEDENLGKDQILLDQARKKLKSQIKVLEGNYSLHLSRCTREDEDKPYNQKIKDLLDLRESFLTYIQGNYDNNKNKIFKQLVSDFSSPLYAVLNRLWEQNKKKILNIFGELIDNKIEQTLQTNEAVNEWKKP